MLTQKVRSALTFIMATAKSMRLGIEREGLEYQSQVMLAVLIMVSVYNNHNGLSRGLLRDNHMLFKDTLHYAMDAYSRFVDVPVEENKASCLKGLKDLEELIDKILESYE